MTIGTAGIMQLAKKLELSLLDSQSRQNAMHLLSKLLSPRIDFTFEGSSLASIVNIIHNTISSLVH
jgi:hypothetical protein